MVLLPAHVQMEVDCGGDQPISSVPVLLDVQMCSADPAPRQAHEGDDKIRSF